MFAFLFSGPIRRFVNTSIPLFKIRTIFKIRPYVLVHIWPLEVHILTKSTVHGSLHLSLKFGPFQNSDRYHYRYESFCMTVVTCGVVRLWCGMVVVWCGCGLVWLWCGMVVVWYGCDVVWLWCGTVVMWYGFGVVDLKKIKKYKMKMFGSMTVGIYQLGRSSKDQSQSMWKVVD